ncbi:GGDEF domain-containing protein [Nocardia sp. NPDC051981]|uniref:GGDEF domain-containing protein n=1 Tax=Nocardia sp. NPDC051981 TaxID=3155417 RepID=UPI00342C3373
MITVDLDRFKNLNDTFGHSAGEQALVRVATCLRASVPSGTVVARSGGEEFIILTRLAEAERMCPLNRTAVRSPRVSGSLSTADQWAPLFRTSSAAPTPRCTARNSWVETRWSSRRERNQRGRIMPAGAGARRAEAGSLAVVQRSGQIPGWAGAGRTPRCQRDASADLRAVCALDRTGGYLLVQSPSPVAVHRYRRSRTRNARRPCCGPRHSLRDRPAHTGREWAGR